MAPPLPQPPAVDDYYLKILEDFPALIWRAGLNMKCDHFNRTWLAFTGRTMEQELGDGWAEGVHPDDLEACFQTYVSHFQQQKPFAMFYRLRNAAGQYRWIKDLGRPFYSPQDEFLGYIGSCYDVTEERENAEKLAEMNRAKDQFFSLVAHDLRGPLGAIEGLTEVLDGSLTDFDPSTLGTIIHELSQAVSKTNLFLEDLLNWSHSQLQGTTCRPRPVVLAQLIREASAPLEEGLLQKRLQLEVDCPGAIEVFADPDMVKTVLRNLLSNALKFSREGGIIRVSAEPADQRVRLAIQDSGIGIPPAALAGLFRLGSQTSRAGTRGERGTGLGLILCRDFVEMNGGTITATSQEGEGTTFTVDLPAASEAKRS